MSLRFVFANTLKAQFGSRLFSNWPERAGLATFRFSRVFNPGDFPARVGFRQHKGVNPAMAEFTVYVHIVIGPDDGDAAAEEDRWIPDALDHLALVGCDSLSGIDTPRQSTDLTYG